MEQPLILVEHSNSITVLRLNNPPLNLQTLAATQLLEQIVTELDDDDQVHVVILTGSGGPVFCAGSDIREFPELKENFIEAKIRRENKVFDSLAQMGKPVIAAIDGKSLGGGSELTLCCDFRILDETAVMGFPEIMLGGFPGSGGILRLPILIGPSKAQELMSLGCTVNAQEALRLGLVTQIAPAGGALESALVMAEQLKKVSLKTLRTIKACVQASRYMTRAEIADYYVKLYRQLIKAQVLK